MSIEYTAEQIKAVLSNAAARIERDGFIKDAFYREDGNTEICSVSAIYEGAGGERKRVSDLFWNDDPQPAAELAKAAIAAFEKYIGVERKSKCKFALCDWNNAPEQTGESVIAKMREFAAQ